MDKARDILLRYAEKLLTCAEALGALASLAVRKEIPDSVAIGFILQIANEEANKETLGVNNGSTRTTSDSP